MIWFSEIENVTTDQHNIMLQSSMSSSTKSQLNVKQQIPTYR